MANSKITGLESKEKSLKEELVYLQSQSMRNNLIFVNIQEDLTAGKAEDTKTVLRKFLVQKTKIVQEEVNNLQFDRVHRMGVKRDNSVRSIVAKFTLFKKESLLESRLRYLKGQITMYQSSSQRRYQKKIRPLLRKMKEEKEKGNRAWVSYDTFYVNGHPVKNTNN